MNGKFWRLAFWLILLFLFVKFYVFSPNIKESCKQTDISGQKFKVPNSPLEIIPLNRSVSLSSAVVKGAQEYSISTQLADYVFSSEGACLVEVDYKKHLDNLGLPIKTLHRSSFEQAGFGALFLAFEDGSPLNYHVVSTDLSSSLDPFIEFETTYKGWKINKRFTLSQEKHSLSLTCDFTRVGGSAAKLLQPRLVFPGPFSAGFSGEKVSGIVNGLRPSDVLKLPNNETETCAWKLPRLFGAEDKYFLNSFVSGGGSAVRRAYFDRVSNSRLLSILEMHPVEDSTFLKFDFYFGPKSVPAMAAVDENLEKTLSFGVLSWICHWIIDLLEMLYSFLGNYGLAIVLLTLLIKIPFFPIFFYARRKAAAANEFDQAYAKEIGAINRRYSSSLVAKTEALSKFYSSHGQSQYSKMAVGLPTLLQLPIVFSLYRVLGSYISLYNAPFALWITDLSYKDPYFILPLLLGFGVFFQQRLSKSVSSNDDVMAKVTKYGMPIILFFVFSGLPAGLVLYWLCNSLALIVEEGLFSFFTLGQKTGFVVVNRD